MNILFDENITSGAKAFSALGTARAMPGRFISRDDLADIDALFVRSVTKVNAHLLDNTPVRFVATATSGTDHIDREYLAKNNIGFSDASGSNANSVAEYVTAALLVLANRYNVTLKDLSIGVVGVGHVGTRVVEKARALGMTVLCNDPPRARRECDFDSVPLHDILKCNVVTIHTPLTYDGIEPTFHLIGKKEISALEKNAILIQTSRGAVVDEKALLDRLQNGVPLHPVLDVWENEPTPMPALIEVADIATPHIAGYSQTGKIAATAIVYTAACHYFAVEPVWHPSPLPKNMPLPKIILSPQDDAKTRLRNAVVSLYDIIADDTRMRGIFNCAEAEYATYFDELRKNYPIRLEFPYAEVHGKTEDIAFELSALGFTL